MKRRLRLDRLLVDRGLCESRTRAQGLIMSGSVIVNGQAQTKPGCEVELEAEIRVKRSETAFVSRGGLKLQSAIDHFGAAHSGLAQPDEQPLDASASSLEISGKIVMDVGASTGGFTDCALRNGAARVYAVDVGYGQLAWSLVQDPRVVVLDRTHIRELQRERVPDAIDVALVDCSFISAVKVLRCLPPFLAPHADVIVLVKPQFEVGRAGVGKGGIVRDPALRAGALATVEAESRALGFHPRDHIESPIAGRDGNREFLLWLCWGAGAGPNR